MIEADLVAMIEAVKRENYDEAIERFHQHSAEEWNNDLYDWKSDHAQEFSDFIQKIVEVLPATASLERVIALSANYLLSICHLSMDTADLAAKTVVTYWNRHQEGDPKMVREYLDDLREHPDTEEIEQIAASAKNIY